MAQIANWNGHKFVVKPKLIQSFEELTIKGASETKDKTTNGQKYVERKAGEATQVTFNVMLNALTGCKDVFGEAQTYVEEARKGATDYMYLGSSKIIGAKLMLASAEVTEIVTQPGKGDVWISCKIKLTMKQGGPSEDDGSTGSGGPPPWTAVYYCLMGNGEIKKVYGSSDKSYADALKKAKEKVPKNAIWSGPKKEINTDTKQLVKNIGIQAQSASQDKKPKYGLDVRTENQNKATAKLGNATTIMNAVKSFFHH